MMAFNPLYLPVQDSLKISDVELQYSKIDLSKELKYKMARHIADYIVHDTARLLTSETVHNHNTMTTSYSTTMFIISKEVAILLDKLYKMTTDRDPLEVITIQELSDMINIVIMEDK